MDTPSLQVNDLIIRPAQSTDRAAMERICAHTWTWGDYVPEVWEEWLAAQYRFPGGHEQSLVLVGDLDGQVVALSHISFQERDQVWLEAMRVDPGYRQRGIAGRFLNHSIDYANQRGARVIRLGTSSTNTAVHIMTARAGMNRVGAYVLWTAEALPGSAEPTLLTAEDADCVKAWLMRSPVLTHTHGLYSADWIWQELSAEHMIQLLDAGQVAGLLAPSGKLRALATIHAVPEDKTVWIGFADSISAGGSQAEALTDLVIRIRHYAARVGAESVEVMLPDVTWLPYAFQAAGFGFGDWAEDELWIFERWLGQAVSSQRNGGDGHGG